MAGVALNAITAAVASVVMRTRLLILFPHLDLKIGSRLAEQGHPCVYQLTMSPFGFAQGHG
jgi:hypothetical protein